MWKSMEDAAVLHLVALEYEISVATARRRRDDVFVKRKWYEDNYNKQINDGAHGTHRFGSSFQA